MAAPVRCRTESARVRADKVEALTDLIRQLFNRRHLAYVAPNDQAWLRADLVQSLRRQSEVYRAISTMTDGPLPFGIGYFRVQNKQIEPISDTMPVEDPEVLVRLLSEFLEPSARLYFGEGTEATAWRIDGMDAIKPLAPDASAKEEQR